MWHESRCDKSADPVSYCGLLGTSLIEKMFFQAHRPIGPWRPGDSRLGIPILKADSQARSWPAMPWHSFSHSHIFFSSPKASGEVWKSHLSSCPPNPQVQHTRLCAVQFLPTAGNGTNLWTRRRVAGVNLLAFWTRTLRPTFKRKKEKENSKSTWCCNDSWEEGGRSGGRAVRHHCSFPMTCMRRYKPCPASLPIPQQSGAVLRGQLALVIRWWVFWPQSFASAGPSTWNAPPNLGHTCSLRPTSEFSY